MASIAAAGGGGGGVGTGFLINRGLLLTTHTNVPSVAAAEAAEVHLLHGRVPARLVPQRFFITSSVLDLTIVGLDTLDADSSSQAQQPHYLKTCSHPALNLGSVVYVLGHTDKRELMVGEGKVVIATDNLIKLSADGLAWCPGSAGFDDLGNLAFMVCDPMKLASSPTAKSSASSSSSLSWKNDSSMQFGIPIPIICDWLHQHWEGSFDELSKPKLPLMRLMPTGQKSEYSCASFTKRCVFKSTEGVDDYSSLSAQIISRSRFQTGSSSSANGNASHEEYPLADLHSTHEQGIPTPEIYESPRLTSGPVQKKEKTPIQLLDINFPPRNLTSIVLPLPLKQLLPNADENSSAQSETRNASAECGNASEKMLQANGKADHTNAPISSCQEDCRSEVQSSSSPVEMSGLPDDRDGLSSDEETMYSAETMESRNYPSPKENNFQQVGRSQSCVNYSRWTSTQRNALARKGTLPKQHSLVSARKTRSQAVTPQRSHEFYSPTVCSSMKKRNSSEQPTKPRQREVQVSPRWMF